MQGVIGEVKPVHSEWMLDTRHGEDFCAAGLLRLRLCSP